MGGVGRAGVGRNGLGAAGGPGDGAGENRRLARTAVDSRQLVAWRAAGYSVTRRACEGYGMPRRRWVWALGLLRLARVLGDGAASADAFLLDDVEECAAAIERAVRAVEVRGLETLILRLPKGAAKMPRGRG